MPSAAAFPGTPPACADAAAASSSLPPKLVMKVIFSSWPGDGVRERERDSEVDSEGELRGGRRLQLPKTLPPKSRRVPGSPPAAGTCRKGTSPGWKTRSSRDRSPFVGIVGRAVSPCVAAKGEGRRNQEIGGTSLRDGAAGSPRKLAGVTPGTEQGRATRDGYERSRAATELWEPRPGCWAGNLTWAG